MKDRTDEIAVLAQGVAKALQLRTGANIRAITNALLEIQRRTYEHAANVVEREIDPIEKIRACAKTAESAFQLWRDANAAQHY